MKSILPLLVVGILIRFILIPITLHPDFRAVNLAGYLIAQKGEVLSFYDHLSKLPRTDQWVKVYGDNLFIYPPLPYVVHGIFNKLLFWAYPKDAFFTLLNDIGRIYSSSGFPFILYLLKLPYLLADFACLWLLLKMFPDKKKLAAAIWLFNPVTLYSAYMMAQFDIFIAFFVLLSVYYLPKNPTRSAASIGLSACFKPFTLLLLPLVPGNKLKNIIVGISIYVVTLLPWIGSPAFRQYALLANQTDKMFFAKVMLSGSQYLSFFMVGLVLIYWWNWFYPKSKATWQWLMLPLLLFYSITHYHPQWFTWLTPLVVVAYLRKPGMRLAITILVLVHTAMLLFFEKSLNFGMFNLDFSFFDLVNKYISADLVVSGLRSLLAATAAYLVFTTSTEDSKLS